MPFRRALPGPPRRHALVQVPSTGSALRRRIPPGTLGAVHKAVVRLGPAAIVMHIERRE